MKTLYTNQKPLEIQEYSEMGRQLGIWISEPFFHVGRKETNVEICYERLSLNSITFGGNYPLSEAKEKAISDTSTIINHLDKVIAELLQHRERLSNSIIEIDALDLSA